MLSSRFCGSNWMLTLSSSTKLSVTKNCLVILSALQRYHSLVLESHLPTVKIHLKLVGMETAPIHFCRAYCEGEESFCGLTLKIGSRRNDIQFITPTCNFFSASWIKSFSGLHLFHILLNCSCSAVISFPQTVKTNIDTLHYLSYIHHPIL